MIMPTLLLDHNIPVPRIVYSASSTKKIDFFSSSSSYVDLLCADDGRPGSLLRRPIPLPLPLYCLPPHACCASVADIVNIHHRPIADDTVV